MKFYGVYRIVTYGEQMYWQALELVFCNPAVRASSEIHLMLMPKWKAELFEK